MSRTGLGAYMDYAAFGDLAQHFNATTPPTKLYNAHTKR